MFLLKQLCPRNHFGKTSLQLQLIVKELTERYPHYSDSKLATELSEELNQKIARRTITKYRHLSGTSSSYTRSKLDNSTS